MSLPLPPKIVPAGSPAAIIPAGIAAITRFRTARALISLTMLGALLTFQGQQTFSSPPPKDVAVLAAGTAETVRPENIVAPAVQHPARPFAAADDAGLEVLWRLRSGIIGPDRSWTDARGPLPDAITGDIVHLFERRIDFRRDVQPGDTFHAIYLDTPRMASAGVAKHRHPTLLAVALNVRGEWLRAVRADGNGVVDTHLGERDSKRDRKRSAAETPKTTSRSDSPSTYYALNGQPIGAPPWQRPTQATRISSKFGPRTHPLYGARRHHDGIDLAAPSGSPVYASAPGDIEFAGWRRGFGNLVIMRHAKGYSSYYAHLSTISAGVRRGVRFQQGARLGAVGSTGDVSGPHLHFEVRRSGVPIDPSFALQTPLAPLTGARLATFQRGARALIDQMDRMRTAGLDGAGQGA